MTGCDFVGVALSTATFALLFILSTTSAKPLQVSPLFLRPLYLRQYEIFKLKFHCCIQMDFII